MHRRNVIRALLGLPIVEAIARRKADAAPREILLAHMDVAGTPYYHAERLAGRMRPGDRFTLRRQPDNPHDAYAIEVLGPKRRKIGYVPRRFNKMPARLMDAGKPFSAQMTSIEKKGGWLRIRFALRLADGQESAP